MKRVLVTGAAGQLGQAFADLLPASGDVCYVDLAELNLADANAVRHFLREFAPELVIHCAAYTAVDAAEDHAELAQAVNAESVAVIASELAQTGGALVHFSTDYVFDGTKDGAYLPDDAPNPLSVYGRTKLGGERAALDAGIPAWVLRTSWVYSHRGANFMLTMLKLMREREELSVVADQIGAPTCAEDMAQWVMTHLVRPLMRDDERVRRNSGLFHLVAGGNTSWHGYASHIREFMAADPELAASLKCRRVLPIPAAKYPSKSVRPLNSRLDMSGTVGAFGGGLDSWEVALDRSLRRWAQVQESR